MLLRVRERYALGAEPFILSLGTIQPRKNYGRLIEAFQRIDSAGARLVIAGGKGWLDRPIYEQAVAAGLGKRIQFLGFVKDADLPALYSAAAVFALPSLYEGFGLPTLEAMACGTPVVTSNVSSLPEIVAGAALTVDPRDVDGLAGALSTAMADSALRTRLTTAGVKRAKMFTWEKAAKQLYEHYQKLADD
jgi:glycosyltransferase involved in cell wall biosynthesis